MNADSSSTPEDLVALLAASEELQADIEDVLGSFLWPELGERGVATLVLCQIVFEHAVSMRLLLSATLHTSAIALVRVQFDAVVRAAWLLHCATDEQAAKLAAPLSEASEQGAKNLPSTHDMIGELERHGPRGAGPMFLRFQTRMSRGLNSVVHAGIHPIQRRAQGYPAPLLRDLVKNSNAVSMLAVVVLSELCAPVAGFNQRYSELYQRHKQALPSLEAF